MRLFTYAFFGVIALFIVVLGAGCVNRYREKNQGSTPVSYDNAGLDSLATTNTDNMVAGTQETNNDSTANKAPTVKISSKGTSYAQVVARFGPSGYRYQFANCSGLPGTFTVKKGVQFMLDNRDDKQHVLRLANRSYTIPAYGYALTTVNTAGTYQITCDGGGSAQVRVQN